MEQTQNKMDTTNTQSDLPIKDEIRISKAQLDAVVADAVKKALAGRTSEKPKRITDRIVKVRFYKDKLVRSYGNVDEQRDTATGKLVAYMDVTLDDQVKPERVKYLEFLDKTPQYRALVKKISFDEIVESEGEIQTKNPDEAKIEKKNFVSRVETAEVTKRVKKSEIELMEGPFAGQTFTVEDNKTVNF